MIKVTRMLDGATLIVTPDDTTDVRARTALASVDARGRHCCSRVLIRHDDGLQYRYERVFDAKR